MGPVERDGALPLVSRSQDTRRTGATGDGWIYGLPNSRQRLRRHRVGETRGRL